MKLAKWSRKIFFIVFGGIFLLFTAHLGYAKDTLIIGIPDMPPGADNDFHSHAETWNLIMNLYSHGLEYKYVPCGEPGGPDVLKPDFGNMEPRLFEKWEEDPDGKTVTFYLRKGIKSAHGNEFTTEDVLWRYQRNFANKGLGTFFLMCENISNIDQVEIIDRYTFKTTATAPTPMALHMKTNHYVGYIDSKEAKKHATADDPWAAKYIARHGGSGLGPYTVKEWRAGDRIVLEANPNYFRGVPKIETIILKVIPESSSRLAMLRQGTIHVATALTPRELQSLDGVPGVRNIHVKANSSLWGLMNNRMKPFDNKLVRQALNYATPRKDIAETAFYGYAHPWKACLPMMYSATTSSEEFPYDYDLEKAKQLLAKAGYGEGLELELAYDAAYAPAETTATLMKSSFEKIGVKLALRKMPSGAFMTQVAAGEMPFALWWDMPMLPDPNYAITLTYHSKSAINYERYENHEVDKLLEEGNSILNWEERVAFHKKIQRLVMDDAPIIFVIERDYMVGLRDNIVGWNWATMQETDWSLVSFK